MGAGNASDGIVTIDECNALAIVLRQEVGDVVEPDMRQAGYHCACAIDAAARYDFKGADLHARAARILAGLPAVATSAPPAPRSTP